MATESKPERMSRIVQPLRSGQITIPAEFRKRLGITPDTLLQMRIEDGELRIRPLATPQTAGNSAWFRELYEYFAPVREEASRYSSDQIDAAIDEAVQAVRRRHARRA